MRAEVDYFAIKLEGRTRPIKPHDGYVETIVNSRDTS